MTDYPEDLFLQLFCLKSVILLAGIYFWLPTVALLTSLCIFKLSQHCVSKPSLQHPFPLQLQSNLLLILFFGDGKISQPWLFWTSSLPDWVWLRGEISENKPLGRAKNLSSLYSAEQWIKKVVIFISCDPVHLWSIYSSLILCHRVHILLNSKFALKTALLWHKSDICSSFGHIPIFMFMKLERSWNACTSSFQLSLIFFQLNVLTRSQIKWAGSWSVKTNSGMQSTNYRSAIYGSGLQNFHIT